MSIDLVTLRLAPLLALVLTLALTPKGINTTAMPNCDQLDFDL